MLNESKHEEIQDIWQNILFLSCLLSICTTFNVFLVSFISLYWRSKGHDSKCSPVSWAGGLLFYNVTLFFYFFHWKENNGHYEKTILILYECPSISVFFPNGLQQTKGKLQHAFPSAAESCIVGLQWDLVFEFIFFKNMLTSDITKASFAFGQLFSWWFWLYQKCYQKNLVLDDFSEKLFSSHLWIMVITVFSGTFIIIASAISVFAIIMLQSC